MLSNGYILILVWIALVGILSITVRGVYRTELVNGVKEKRVIPLFAVIAILPLVIWAGYRGYVGDTAAYMKDFQGMPSSLSDIASYMTGIEKDPLFYFVSGLIKCIIGNRCSFYFIIIAAIQCYFLFRTYRKYSTSYMISFFLFIVSTDYISWIFNGMRQFVAVTITVISFPWIVEKKFIHAIIIILFASLFHQSALLVLPFIFVVQGKAWNKRTLLFIGIIVLAVSFADRFTNILDTMLAETQYKDVVSNYDNYYLPSKENYAICLDRRGSILWTSDKIEYPNNHLNKILQVVTRQASLEYLGYLKSLNIPYIVNGEDDLDLNSLMDTLFSQFNIDLLSVNGGGIINGSFFNEDLIDEISLIVSPMVEGNQGGSIADYKGTSPKFPKSFHLEKINRFGDSLEIIYKKEAATKR